MTRKLLCEIVSILFIILFVYTAAAKLLDFQKFRVQVGQSPLLTDLAGVVVWLVPALEIAVSVMLAFSRFRTIGLYGAFSLMVLFTAYIVAILNFSNHIPCSCGGVLEDLSWKDHLIFNSAFSVVALAGIVVDAKKTAYESGQ